MVCHEPQLPQLILTTICIAPEKHGKFQGKTSRYLCMWQCTYNCSGGTVAQLSHLEDENGTKSCWHLVASSSKQPAERIEAHAINF